MGIIGSYRDLDVWALSMDGVDEVLRRVKAMPRDEFDLRRQIKRAAISIPANVAEGWCRKDRRQAYQNHISIAMGSGGELPDK
jgi:four helix bundle protein